ncbi:unnamed protein product [Adineta steineri]|uniref:Uncharacterized protein n=1 Tax=Adineta steineri TaxID=433720 RepID=A0A814MRG5_9BILA|nr:unnamed protein product [Adineta steineri]CAF4082559.1 unnamed protein product [Adineta steineri]
MTATQFTTIKQYILLKGDRRTYCNMYNDNPHLLFGTYHIYLNPSVGQFNINCDPNKSDFDTIVIQDQSSKTIYYDIKLNEDEQTLIFDPPESKSYFDKLYTFVHENKQDKN